MALMITVILFSLTIYSSKMTINNYTPHPITVLVGNEMRTYPSTGLIRLKVSITDAGMVGDVRITKTVFGEPEGLPDFVEGQYYIVSQIVKNACDRRDLLVPAEVVRDEEGQIMFCRSFGI